MITLHGSCRMCGGLVASIEVEVPHATAEFRKSRGVSGTGILCTSICQTCVRAAVAAWAKHGAADWAKMKAEIEAAHAEAEDG